jgi:hypothetical protein
VSAVQYTLFQTLYVASTNTDKGLTFQDSNFAFMKLDGFLTAMLAVLVKIEITCPMEFNWFPFDSQQCHFVMAPLNPGIKLVSMLEMPERMERQNIMLNYEVAFSNLPTHKMKYIYPEVSVPLSSVPLSSVQLVRMFIIGLPADDN